jgi:hypothetical protein
MITREDLYSLVWSVPMTVAAKRLNISDVYLAKVCIALAVPHPPRGWWRKVNTGHAGVRPPLPMLKPGFPDRWAKAQMGSAPIKQYYRFHAPISPAAQDDDWHALVRLSSNYYASAQPGSDGPYLATRRSEAIDLTCTANTLADALNFADALFKQFESGGHSIHIARGHGLTRPVIENWIKSVNYTKRIPLDLRRPKASTIAIVGGVPIGLAIMEISEEVEMRYLGHGQFGRASENKKVAGITWTVWQRVPTGRLKLVTYSPHFPSPWQRRWIINRRRSMATTAKAIVTEVESLARFLPHSSFYLSQM